jgi:hypothetical protein
VRGVFADQLQFAQVLAQPLADGHAKFGGAGRQVGVEERRQLAACAVDHTHEFVEGGSGIFCFVEQEADGAGKDQGQHADDQGAEQRHRQPACAAAFDQPLQLGGEHVDQFIDQQTGQQAGQQFQRQYEEQSAEDDDVAGQQQHMTLRKRWHTASKRTALKDGQSASLEGIKRVDRW